jgi:hypothetical protein
MEFVGLEEFPRKDMVTQPEIPGATCEAQGMGLTTMQDCWSMSKKPTHSVRIEDAPMPTSEHSVVFLQPSITALGFET